MDMTARYLAVFLPVALIALQSYFKTEFISDVSHLVSAWPDSLYWLARLGLFAWFIAAIYKLAPNVVPTPVRPMDAYAKERSARDPLLGLRALACLNVIMGHWFMVVFTPLAPPVTSVDIALRYGLSFSPWCGVWMFFTLSGYLMGKGFVTGRHTTSSQGLQRFYHNRVLRIFPIYFIAVLIVGVLVSPATFDLRTASAWDAVLSIALFDMRDGGPIGALWSVSTEFQFYLLAPLLFILLATLSSRRSLLIGATAVVLIGLSTLKMHTLRTHPELWHDKIYYPVLINLDCFLVGMVTSILADSALRRQRYIRNGLMLGFVMTLGLQVVASTWSFPEMSYYPGYPGSATRFDYLAYAPAATAIATGLIIYVFELAKRDKPSANTILWKLSTTAGLMTYCLYVFHEPVLLSVRRLFPADISMFTAIKIFPFGLALTIGLAYIFYAFVERQFDSKRYGPAHPKPVDAAPHVDSK